MKFSLKNKWVLITGASSGFGAAAATAFGAEGAKLLLGARRLDRLKITAAAAKKSGAAQAHFHELDVANTASVETFIAWVRKTIKSQPLHVLVNNAGGAHGTDPVASGKDADWETMLQSNVLGVLRMTRAALPLLPPDAHASIINIPASLPSHRLTRAARSIARPRRANGKSPAPCATNFLAAAFASVRLIQDWRKRNSPSSASRATPKKRRIFMPAPIRWSPGILPKSSSGSPVARPTSTLTK